MSNLTFEEKGHNYFLDGKPLTGVTTILGVALSKPQLIQWAANMAVEFIQEETRKIIRRGDNWMDELGDNWERILKEAKTAHRSTKEKAGNFGSNVHKAIENWIKNPDYKSELNEAEAKAFNNFVEWAKENKVKFLESEKRLYSEKNWYAGTMDLVVEIDGKQWVGDIKTSSNIYPEHFAQCAGYHLALNEMGEYQDISGYIIVNVKKNGTVDEKRVISTEVCKEFFLACLTIYRSLEKIKSLIN
jgi:hypothetical protein